MGHQRGLSRPLPVRPARKTVNGEVQKLAVLPASQGIDEDINGPDPENMWPRNHTGAYVEKRRLRKPQNLG